MKKILIITFVIALISSALIIIPTSLKLKSQGLCDFVPCENASCPDGNCPNALTDTESIIKFSFTLIFVAIIILGISMILRAVVKIIQSEGDEKKMQEGIEYMRGVMFGVIIIFVGIIGIVIITVLFNAQDILNQEPGDPPLLDLPVL